MSVLSRIGHKHNLASHQHDAFRRLEKFLILVIDFAAVASEAARNQSGAGDQGNILCDRVAQRLDPPFAIIRNDGRFELSARDADRD